MERARRKQWIWISGAKTLAKPDDFSLCGYKIVSVTTQNVQISNVDSRTIVIVQNQCEQFLI